MQEIKIEQEGSDVVSHRPTKGAVPPHGVLMRAAREPLWGVVLLACMLIFVIASVGGIGWVVYSQWKTERAAENQPSIAALPEPSEEKVEPSDTAGAPAPQAATPEKTDGVTAAQKLAISVLNGGGTKGSAGILADLLKKEGYLKTNVGNTLKNYTGTTVYYGAGLDKEAEIIRQSVAKKYPQAKMLPADAANKETSVSQMTVIVGK